MQVVKEELFRILSSIEDLFYGLFRVRFSEAHRIGALELTGLCKQ